MDLSMKMDELPSLSVMPNAVKVSATFLASAASAVLIPTWTSSMHWTSLSASSHSLVISSHFSFSMRSALTIQLPPMAMTLGVLA